MTTNSTGPAQHREEAGSDVAPEVKPLVQLDAQRLEALRCDLDEGRYQWGEEIASTVEEDYRQLMKDLGLR